MMCTTEDVARQVRHAIRGELHTMMLCADAAATGATSPAEQLEWLGFLEASCERVIALLDTFVPPPGTGGDDDDDPAATPDGGDHQP